MINYNFSTQLGEKIKFAELFILKLNFKKLQSFFWGNKFYIFLRCLIIHD